MASMFYDKRVNYDTQKSEVQLKIFESQCLLAFQDDFAGPHGVLNLQLDRLGIEQVFKDSPSYDEISQDAIENWMPEHELLQMLTGFVTGDAYTSTIAIRGEFPRFLADSIIQQLSLREGPGCWSAKFDLPFEIQYAIQTEILASSQQASFDWQYQYMRDVLDAAGIRIALRWEYSNDNRRVFESETCHDILKEQNQGIDITRFINQTKTAKYSRNCVGHLIEIWCGTIAGSFIDSC